MLSDPRRLDYDDLRRLPPAGSVARKTRLAVNKITWKKAGGVTEPGRYMFTFGWLTIAAEDLAVWRQFPDAAFTLVKMPAATDDSEEFYLGAFELGEDSAPSRG